MRVCVRKSRRKSGGPAPLPEEIEGQFGPGKEVLEAHRVGGRHHEVFSSGWEFIRREALVASVR